MEEALPETKQTSGKYLFIALPFLCIIFFLSLTPVVERDALIHHLAMPKIWLKESIFHVDPFRVYSFYPANMHLLYYFFLKTGYEFLPKTIHAFFLIATAIILYRYVKYKTKNVILSMLAFVFLITIPINQRLASECYVDLGLLFFSTLSFVYFLYWKNSCFRCQKYFYISAIGSGIAFGTKYNGMIPFSMINIFVFFSFYKIKKDKFRSLMYSIIFFIIVFLLASPWLIRNYYASGGNPFYPLFETIFPNSLHILEPLYDNEYNEISFRIASGETFSDLLLLPVRLFFTGEDNNFLQFDGKLNPMMLLLLPFVFIPYFVREKVPNVLGESHNTYGCDLYYILAFSLYVLFFSLFHAIRIRYAIAFIPGFIVLNIVAIENLIKSHKIYLVYIGYLFVVIYITFNMLYTMQIFNRIDTYKYLTFKETKIDYLRRKVYLYDMYEFINRNTSKYSIIYDVFCGHRSYYVDRAYIHEQRDVDTYFYNYMVHEKDTIDYIKYLRSINYKNHKVTHLLIKPYLFLESFGKMFYGAGFSKDYFSERRVQKFVNFLNSQKILFSSNGVVLYELVYAD